MQNLMIFLGTEYTENVDFLYFSVKSVYSVPKKKHSVNVSKK